MLKIQKEWAMPNKNTFSIKPIRNIIEKYSTSCNTIIDPFANSSKIGTITNDLNLSYDTTYHMDALDFLKHMQSRTADLVLYDPPFLSKTDKGVL